jgi:hypothetical protein
VAKPTTFSAAAGIQSHLCGNILRDQIGLAVAA